MNDGFRARMAMVRVACGTVLRLATQDMVNGAGAGLHQPRDRSRGVDWGPFLVYACLYAAWFASVIFLIWGAQIGYAFSD